MSKLQQQHGDVNMRLSTQSQTVHPFVRPVGPCHTTHDMLYTLKVRLSPSTMHTTRMALTSSHHLQGQLHPNVHSLHLRHHSRIKRKEDSRFSAPKWHALQVGRKAAPEVEKQGSHGPCCVLWVAATMTTQVKGDGCFSTNRA